MMQLHVHLHQGLLHVLNVSGTVFDQALTLTQIGS